MPFDSEGFVAAFSAEMGYGNLAEEAKPSGSVLVSNRWDTGIGEFGVMANAAYSEVVTESQGVQLLRFFRAENVAAYGGGTKWIPGGIDIRQNTYDRTRKGVSLAGQWRSPEDAVTSLLQYNRSEYENNWEEYSLSAGIGNSQTPQSLIIPNEFSSTRRRHAGVRVRQPRRVPARRHRRRREPGLVQRPVRIGEPRPPERLSVVQLCYYTGRRGELPEHAWCRPRRRHALHRRRPTSPKISR